ncbi:tetratricopeptide repeat-containing sensor histidine kinase [Aquimarina rhabdastrellae]
MKKLYCSLLGILCFLNCYAQETALDKQFKHIRSYFSSTKADTVPVLLHRLIKENKDYDSKIKAYTVMGQFYNTSNVLDSAAFYGNLILEKITDNDPKRYERLTRAHNILAIANTHKGLFQDAAKWHYKGIDAADKGDDYDLYYTHLHGLANVYRIQKEYDKALEYFKKCLDQTKYTKVRYASYINIGLILSNQGDIDGSNEHYQKALEICESRTAVKCQIIVLINTAANYGKQKNYGKALELYQKAYDLTSKHHYKKNSVNALHGLADIHIKNNQAYKAFPILDSALTIAKRNNYFQQQLAIYQTKINTYTASKEYSSAFQTLQLRTALKDSIQTLQKNKEISALEVQYETLQKEKEIISLQKEQQAKDAEINKQKGIKNTVLIAFLIFLIPLIILLIVYYQKLQTQHLLHIKQKEINQQKINTLIKDQELKLIKASVKGQDLERKRIAQELHDTIGGNLAAIKLQFHNLEAINTKDYSSIYIQLDDTYKLVRDLSHNLIPQKFNTSRFSFLIQEYIKNIAQASELQINTYLSPQEEINLLDHRFQYDIFMMLQELITNTIKHAQASLIEININMINTSSIQLLFEDNGIGFSPDAAHKGIGLSNIKNRLTVLGGELIINSTINNGCVIDITIPIPSVDTSTLQYSQMNA